jgi:hypothetical protein
MSSVLSDRDAARCFRIDDDADRVDVQRVGEGEVVLDCQGRRPVPQIRKDLEPDPEVSVGMLLQLVLRVRRVAPDAGVRAGQLYDDERGHRDRGTGQRHTRETRETPPRRKRRREYRNLDVDGIPESGRSEERSEHARLGGVESETEFCGRVAARDDELGDRHRGDDDVVNQERESEQRRHQPSAKGIDRLHHEQESGERPQPRDENYRAPVQ